MADSSPPATKASKPADKKLAAKKAPSKKAPSKKASVAALLPVPADNRWGVVLGLIDDHSDKEYRIVVLDNVTVYQWGRRSADGEVNRIVHASPEEATKAARSQWAAKEAKGYWPVTGVLGLAAGTAVPSYGSSVIRLLVLAYRDALNDLGSARAGAQLWLCKLPTRQAPADATSFVARLVKLGGMLPSDATLVPGAYTMVAVTASHAAALCAVCPVAVRAGSRSDDSDRAVADIAETLWREAEPGDGDRQALARALDMARLIVS